MIIAVRIAGQVNIDGDMKESLFRIRLRKKYAASLIKETPANLKLLNRIRNHIAYGPISKEMLETLVKVRGKIKDKKSKADYSKIVKEIEEKDPENWSIKPFFSLHPPRGGIDAKLHFGRKKGVLGDNKEQINKLVERML